MKIVYPTNERKLRRLMTTFDALGFRPRKKKMANKPRINKAFLERVSSFLGSIGGKNTRKGINAFRVIAPRAFSAVPKGQCTVNSQVKEAVVIFLARVIEGAKECERAVSTAGIKAKKTKRIIERVQRKTLAEKEEVLRLKLEAEAKAEAEAKKAAEGAGQISMIPAIRLEKTEKGLPHMFPLGTGELPADNRVTAVV